MPILRHSKYFITMHSVAYPREKKEQHVIMPWVIFCSAQWWHIYNFGSGNKSMSYKTYVIYLQLVTHFETLSDENDNERIKDSRYC